MTYSKKEIKDMEIAAAIAQTLFQEVMETKTLKKIFNENASRITENKIFKINQEIAQAVFQVRQKRTQEEKDLALVHLFGLVTQRTDMVMSVLFSDSKVEPYLVKWFKALKDSKKFDHIDLFTIYKSLDAPILSYIVKEASILSAKMSNKNKPSGPKI